MTMRYFANVTSFEDLKAQYKKLAFANHPDRGGDIESMKAINNEYDQLFPVWKHRAADTSKETAASTRSEFYTSNGWKGENYNPSISLKEIANIIREYVKDVHNDYRFSVTTDYGSMTQSLRVSITEAPADVFVEGSGNTRYIQGIDAYAAKRLRDSTCILTPEAVAVIEDVQNLITSYNRDDSDGMIDYFDRHFYDRFDLGKWDKPYKIVPRVKREPTYTEYETVSVTKTRMRTALKPQRIDPPVEIQPGLLIQLMRSFQYGCYRGAVYQIDQIHSDSYAFAYKLGKGYKNVCKGEVRGNSFSARLDRLKQWVEQGAIRFVELVETTEAEEYASCVRRPKKKTGMVTIDEQPDDAQDASTARTEPAAYTITLDTDTRDGSPLWVLRLDQTLERDEYLTLAKALNGIGGYYSKFKHGFIFRSDPVDTVCGVLSQCCPA